MRRLVAFFGIEIELVAVNSQHGWHGGTNLLNSIFNCRALLFGRRAWPQPFHRTRRTGAKGSTPAGSCALFRWRGSAAHRHADGLASAADLRIVGAIDGYGPTQILALPVYRANLNPSW